jgi:hypothetical protein
MVFRFTFNQVIMYCITDDQRENPGYVEERLAEILEEKFQERREFRDIIEQFRYTNKDLYQKMAQAGESRNAAIGFNKKAKWKLALVLPQDNLQEVKSGPCKDAKNKPKTGKGKFGKGGKVTLGKDKEKKIEIEDVEGVMDDNDDVIQALKWAQDILLKEFEKRKKIRAKKKSLKRRAHKKLQTLWTFHHQAEALKKAKKKALLEGSIYENKDLNKEDTDKKDGLGALVDAVITENDAKPNDEEEDIEHEEAKTKRKTMIINLQKRLSFKKARGTKIKTEEEKVLEARKHLAWLQEKQKQNIIVDFFGVPTGSKSKSAFAEVFQSLSRHGSEKSNPSLSRQGSSHLTHGDNLDVEKKTGTEISKKFQT